MPPNLSATCCTSVQGFNVVMSDMCHATTGISAADAARSRHLAERACVVALGSLGEGTDGVLVPGGNLLVKILEVRAAQSSRTPLGKPIAASQREPIDCRFT